MFCPTLPCGIGSAFAAKTITNAVIAAARCNSFMNWTPHRPCRRRGKSYALRPAAITGCIMGVMRKWRDRRTVRLACPQSDIDLVKAPRQLGDAFPAGFLACPTQMRVHGCDADA